MCKDRKEIILNAYTIHLVYIYKRYKNYFIMTMNYQYIMSKLGQSELQVGLGSILESGDGGHR